MKLSIKILRNSLLAIVLSVASTSQLVSAAPVVYENSPLFLANRAEPNLFFMMDDSGSMNTEMMSSFEGVPGWGGVMTLSQPPGANFFYLYLFGAGTNLNTATLGNVNLNFWVMPHFHGLFDQPDNRGPVPNAIPYAAPTNNLRGVWRGRSYQYNPLYYNPHESYEPWAGVDNAGNPYPNITDGVSFPAAVNAPFNPYNPGATYNLVANQNYRAYLNTPADQGPDNGQFFVDYSYYPAFYNVWDDDAGTIDDTDSFRKIEIRTGAPQCSTGPDEDALNAEMFLTGCLIRTPAAELQNFANWFSYHRKRSSVAQFGVSSVVNTSSNVRMGYSTINARNPVVLNTMQPDASTGDKRILLDNLFTTTFNQGTPLHQGLELVGEYYDCTNNGNTPFATNDPNCGIDETIVLPATQSPAACQQNYMIMVTDGEYTDTANIIVNNEDNTGVTNSVFDGAPFADTLLNTLADEAMHYYEKDLSTAPNNVVPTCTDENTAQHMVSYILGFGVQGNLDPTTLTLPSGQVDAVNCSVVNPATPAWPNAIAGFADRIDDVVHAAYNGRGQYFSAQNPKQLTDGLNEALKAVLKRDGSASAVAISSSSLTTGTAAFFASFNSRKWDGQLDAFAILPDGNLDLTTSYWTIPAHEALMENNRSHNSRIIVTYNNDPASGNFGPQEFVDTNFSNLSTWQQDDLRTDTTGTIVADDVAAKERLNHIRGSHECETDFAPAGCPLASKPFRSRLLTAGNPRFRLGDIVHSSPVFVGTPVENYPATDPFGIDLKRYRDFRNGNITASGAFSSGKNAQTRTPMVYVGGNDGMLHAFNASKSSDDPNGGKEVWAYIPSALFQTDDQIGPGMHSLTEPAYDHQYYVDLSPTIVDAYVDPDGVGPKNKEWRTVLVGGLRAGGRGLFAIDVTDPDAISSATELESKVMWEFTSKDDKDLGLTYGEARIVPMGDGTSIEWYVIIGNGYNSLHGNTDFTPVPSESQDPKNVTGGKTNPYSSKLFILKLSGPNSDGTAGWQQGSDYWKIDTKLPAGTANLSGVSWTEVDRNGLSAPAVADSDGDSIADFVYAGDLHGRMWAFDITGNNSNAWNIYGGNSPNPLMSATDASGIQQPITTAPTLDFNADVTTVSSNPGKNTPNLLIFFGTGTYVKPTDIANTTPQSFYAVWDSGEANIASGGYTVNRSPTPPAPSLVKQTITTDTAADSSTVRTITPPQTVSYDNTSGNVGWFMDLPDTGERVALEPIVLSSIVFFKTLIPSPNPCEFGGSSWNMFVDASTGNAPSSSLIDFDADGSIGIGDLTAGSKVAAGTKSGTAITNNTLLNVGSGIGTGLNCPQGYDKKAELLTLSDGTTTTSFYCVPENAKTGRFSWRELNF